MFWIMTDEYHLTLGLMRMDMSCASRLDNVFSKLEYTHIVHICIMTFMSYSFLCMVSWYWYNVIIFIC